MEEVEEEIKRRVGKKWGKSRKRRRRRRKGTADAPRVRPCAKGWGRRPVREAKSE